MLDINLLIQGNFGTGSTKHLKTTFSLISYLNRLLVVRFFLEGLIGFLSLGLFINMNVISNNGNSFVGTNRKYKDIFLSVLGATYLKDFTPFLLFYSCLNPIIYGFMSKNFRKSFRSSFGKFSCSGEVIAIENIRSQKIRNTHI